MRLLGCLFNVLDGFLSSSMLEIRGQTNSTKRTFSRGHGSCEELGRYTRCHSPYRESI